jgi:MFS family permease
MALYNPPADLKGVPNPGVRSFAILAGLDAAVRGTLISAMPLVVYETMGSAEVTSQAYFAAGIVALIWGLMVPWATSRIPRRWMYSIGCLLYLMGMALAIHGTPASVLLSVMCNAMAAVTLFICLNAYVMDYIARGDLGRSQSTQMVYAAASWAIGPLLGVWLYSVWPPAPFLLAGGFAATLLAVFWRLRLGNGKAIAKARSATLNPLAYLGRFAAQPRLIAGWIFAVMRSCGWWVYVVYLPIFCVEAGLGKHVGGTALSITNLLLFAAPFMLRHVRRNSVRLSVRVGFGFGAALFFAAALASPLPWIAVGFCMAASVFLVLLDVVGGLPFLMAVKPSERTEMSAVYSSFRDVSGILTPGAAYLVLLMAPLPGIFAAAGLGLGAAWLISGQLHPRLGRLRTAAPMRQ